MALGSLRTSGSWKPYLPATLERGIRGEALNYFLHAAESQSEFVLLDLHGKSDIFSSLSILFYGGKMTTVDPIRKRTDIEKIKSVLLENNYRDYLFFEVGINTGLRISDILKLKVSDIRGKYYIELKEQKTGKLKKFRMNNILRSELEDYILAKNDNNYLFESFRTSGNPLERTRAYCILNHAAKVAGVKIKMGTHTMRKTFGFHFYQQTKDIALLQVLFNHSSPSVTLRYIGINQNILDKATERFVL